MQEKWQQLSHQRLEEVRTRIGSCESVLGGFNLLLDRINHLTSNELEHLVSMTGIDLRACCKTPKQHSVIRSQRDLVELLVGCIASGNSMEVPVGERDVCEWLNDTWAKACKLRVGGQPAHMALAACAIVPRIILAGWPTPEPLAKLLPQEVDNIYLVVSHRGKMQVKPLHQCRGFSGYEYANCAINFSEELQVSVSNTVLTCPKKGRFIANCYPREEWMKPGTSKQFIKSGARATHAFLSGCQSLCPDADTNNLWPGQVSEFAMTTQDLRSEPGCKAIHYEMGTIHSRSLLCKLVEELFPTVDSVGCNEVELIQILDAIGQEKLALQVKKEKSIESVYLGASYLVRRCNLRRLHVHTWPFHVSVSNAKTDTHIIERDALLFGAVMGAAKTYAELDIQDIHITQGLEIPFSEEGLRQVCDLHENPTPLGKCVEDGIFQTKNNTLVCVVPGRVKKGIDSTVGLGDTLSSIAFLAATAKDIVAA